MLKKFLLASAIFAVSTGVVLADNAPFVAISSGVINAKGTRTMPMTLTAGFGGIASPNFYIGAEAFYTPGTYKAGNDSLYKTSYSYGASFIPGMMISDHTMTYARLGVIKSRYVNADSSVNGGQVGVGLQTNLTQSWDIRGEYIYTAYQSKEGIGAVKADQVSVGLVYKFD